MDAYIEYSTCKYSEYSMVRPYKCTVCVTSTFTVCTYSRVEPSADTVLWCALENNLKKVFKKSKKKKSKIIKNK